MNGNSFFWKKGKIGILLIHGLTSSTEEMEELGEFLFEKGYSVSAPLLKGHNTSLSDLKNCSWKDWEKSLIDGYSLLSTHCDSIIIVGGSIGGTLTLHFASTRPEKLAGIVLLAPALFYHNPFIHFAQFLSFFKDYAVKDYKKFYPHRQIASFDIVDDKADSKRIAYRRVPLRSLGEAMKLIRIVKTELSQIECPALLIHSRNDHTIDVKSSFFIYDKILSAKKELRLLTKSGHLPAIDIEKKDVQKEILSFITELSSKKKK